MAKLFFLISGENKTLPLAELSAILEAEKYEFCITEKLDQVIRLETEIKSINAIYLRSAYTRVCALELFTCEPNEKKIINNLNKIDLTSVINEQESFAVRIKRVRNYAEKSTVMDLERIIGKNILQNTKNTRVNLSMPDKIFVGILTSGKLIFGLKIAVICPKPFGERRPRKKPFFHPSAMPSKLARCMVNLAHAKKNDLVLDPFCGTGTTLIEATFIGCRTLGLDAQRKMLEGCKQNLEHFNITPEGLILSDARKHPIIKTNCVITDPPYGRCCSTMNSTTKKIVKMVLFSVMSLLKKGDRICIASPKSIHLSQVGKTVGYKHIESHFVYVHRSLTREIAVFEKQ
ncbi:TRM11 family methyltransferase [Candidatus Bathyarchaeota archaeon]|nr:TRM11 family methyltransferase [Candidatus Bathyarchaeota archaeon]